MNPPTTIIKFLQSDITGKLHTSNEKEYEQWASNFIIQSTDENFEDHAKQMILMYRSYFESTSIKYMNPKLDKRKKKALQKIHKIIKKGLPRPMYASMVRDIKRAEKAQCSVDMTFCMGVELESEERSWTIKHLPFDVVHTGTLGDTHSFLVYLRLPKHTACIGMIVIGPLGWFPCPLLMSWLENIHFGSQGSRSIFKEVIQAEKKGGLETFYKKYGIDGAVACAGDGSTFSFDAELEIEFFEYMDKLGKDLFPFLLCLRIHNYLKKSTNKGGIPTFDAFTVESFRLPNEKSPHERIEHYSFQWIREDKVPVGEAIYGRRIRKNALVKVRRLRKGSSIHGFNTVQCGV